MALIETKKIVEFCEEYLETAKWKDGCHNGLQVEGKNKVGRIITGVSLSEALIKETIKRRADMIMVHHGIFGNNISNPPRLVGYTRQRIKLLLTHDINLCGFHLPLDAHPVIGNNISILRLLGLKKQKALVSPDYGAIGFIGRLPKPILFDNFLSLVNKKLDTRSYAIAGGPRYCRNVGIVSGGASPDFLAASEAGADTFICGDVRESTVRAVEETGINFINAGHYNTEKLGIRNLGELVAKKFKIPVEFADIPNEI